MGFCSVSTRKVANQFYPSGRVVGAKLWEGGKPTTALLSHARAAALLGGDGEFRARPS